MRRLSEYLRLWERQPTRQSHYIHSKYLNRLKPGTKQTLNKRPGDVNILLSTWGRALLMLYLTEDIERRFLCHGKFSVRDCPVVRLLCFQNEDSSLWPTSWGTFLPYPAGTLSTRPLLPSLWVHTETVSRSLMISRRSSWWTNRKQLCDRHKRNADVKLNLNWTAASTRLSVSDKNMILPSFRGKESTWKISTVV